MEGWPSGQRQQTVNLSTEVYESSNLSPSTISLKYQTRVSQLAIALSKLKNKEQKIIVEKINIEKGAQAIVGNVSK